MRLFVEENDAAHGGVMLLMGENDAAHGGVMLLIEENDAARPTLDWICVQVCLTNPVVTRFPSIV